MNCCSWPTLGSPGAQEAGADPQNALPSVSLLTQLRAQSGDQDRNHVASANRPPRPTCRPSNYKQAAAGFLGPPLATWATLAEIAWRKPRRLRLPDRVEPAPSPPLQRGHAGEHVEHGGSVGHRVAPAHCPALHEQKAAYHPGALPSPPRTLRQINDLRGQLASPDRRVRLADDVRQSRPGAQAGQSSW